MSAVPLESLMKNITFEFPSLPQDFIEIFKNDVLSNTEIIMWSFLSHLTTCKMSGLEKKRFPKVLGMFFRIHKRTTFYI